MSGLSFIPTGLDDARLRLEGLARENSGALVLGCMLAAALLVWMAPAAPETRCMLARQAALGMQGALSVAIVLTALAWRAHKPALRLIRPRRGDDGAPPTA